MADPVAIISAIVTDGIFKTNDFVINANKYVDVTRGSHR
jgi:hypothetical protein